nr:MAG TPA: hypothetical protein [Caudoviricetes sp.]
MEGKRRDWNEIKRVFKRICVSKYNVEQEKTT